MGGSDVKSTISFDRFTVDPLKRILLENGETVDLNPKTFDLLLALIEKRDEVVTKDELLERVWEGQFVEENNLTVNISLLRKALGEKKGDKRFIITVPGRGYSFVGAVEKIGDGAGSESSEQTERKETGKQRAGSAAGRPKFMYSVAGLLAAVFIGLGGYWIYNFGKTDKDAAPKKFAIRTYATNGMPQKVNISPSGKFLAYVGRSKGSDSVWVGNLSTGNNIQITRPIGGESIHINFNPDETYVYFVARKESEFAWNLSRVSVFGGAVQELVKDVHSATTFSPDGKRIAFVRRDFDNETSSLITADAETGADEEVVLSLKNPQAFSIHGVSWAPDSQNIAVLIAEAGSDYALTLINLEDGTKKRIGKRLWKSKTAAVWQKDGSGLLILSTEGSKTRKNAQIWAVSYPEGDVKRVTDDLNHYHHWSLGVAENGTIAAMLRRFDPQVHFSPTIENSRDDIKIISSGATRSSGVAGLAILPDGKILFTSGTENSRTLWEMDPDGSKQKQLTPTSGGASDSQPVATNDGKFLVFQSTRSGELEIWRADRDGGNLKQITRGGSNGEPTVSRDGGTVVYTHYQEDGLHKLWRVSIDGGRSGEFSDVTASWPMFSPDGKLVAASYGVSRFAGTTRIAIFPAEGGKPLKILHAPGGELYNRLRWHPDGQSIIYADNKQGLWLHNVTTDKREKLDLVDDFRVGHFAWSDDGKSFVYSGGVAVREIVILEGLD